MYYGIFESIMEDIVTGIDLLTTVRKDLSSSKRDLTPSYTREAMMERERESRELALRMAGSIH